MELLLVKKISFELWLILACLYSPADHKTFAIEVREGKKTEMIFYVKRVESSFEVYADKEMKKRILFLQH